MSGKLIKAMLQLLKDNKDLLARKRLYIEFGCRGDWPEVSHAHEWWQVNGRLLGCGCRKGQLHGRGDFGAAQSVRHARILR